MAKTDNQTLSWLFAPPEEHLCATGGVLCSYSADGIFLERALQRYTGASPGARLASGSIDFTLMTTPKHRVYAPDEIPGLLHLRPRVQAMRHAEFSVLHAKTAVLGFARNPGDRAELFRIIVGTGNWTRSSAGECIEMFWSLDITNESATADRAELGAVAAFLKRLLGSYQNWNGSRCEEILGYAAAMSRHAKGGKEQRFFHSWDTSSLWSIIRRKLGALPTKTNKANFFLCGSGFFEQPAPNVRDKLVIEEICDVLVESSRLTATCRKTVITNANIDDHLMRKYYAKSLTEWEVRSPAEWQNKKLHAKFIFIAHLRNESISHPRLYLGSGNLTRNGFMNSPAKRGNIEAGVLLNTWEIGSYADLKRCLPIGKPLPQTGATKLSEVGDDGLQNDDPDIPPAPIVCFHKDGDKILKPDWDECVMIPQGWVFLEFPEGNGETRREKIEPKQPDVKVEHIPRSIKVLWGEGNSAFVPCIDNDGLFPQSKRVASSLGDWLAEIRGYPSLDEDSTNDDEDENKGDQEAGNNSAPHASVEASRNFPTHTAMELVECLAEKNQGIPEEAAAGWLRHLRYVFERVPPAEVKRWQTVQVNFLSLLLWRDGFAPDWNGPALDRYDLLIAQTAEKWKLSGDPGFEEA